MHSKTKTESSTEWDNETRNSYDFPHIFLCKY